ncbi:MAG: hypothetical protein AAF620_11810 [Bacteroidota bacterium]
MATALKYFTVYFLSGLKFVFGPVFGVANDLPLIAVILLTALGMMTTIYLFTFFGNDLRNVAKRFKKDPKVFTKRNRRFVRIWNRFGLEGVCLLTPLLLTPPGGGLLANFLGANKKKLLKWMWISALGWSTIISLILKYAYWLIEDFI